MENHAANSLSQDVQHAKEYGLPTGLRPDLVCESEGRLIFTVKGLQFYREACSHFGVLADFKKVSTKKDLSKLALGVAKALVVESSAELMADLEAGRVEPQDIELTTALIYGSVDDLLAALDRKRLCAEVGSHVIPVRFNKNWTANNIRSPV